MRLALVCLVVSPLRSTSTCSIHMAGSAFVCETFCVRSQPRDSQGGREELAQCLESERERGGGHAKREVRWGLALPLRRARGLGALPPRRRQAPRVSATSGRQRGEAGEGAAASGGGSLSGSPPLLAMLVRCAHPAHSASAGDPFFGQGYLVLGITFHSPYPPGIQHSVFDVSMRPSCWRGKTAWSTKECTRRASRVALRRVALDARKAYPPLMCQHAGPGHPGLCLYK